TGRERFFAIASATYAAFHAVDQNIFWTSRHFRLKLFAQQAAGRGLRLQGTAQEGRSEPKRRIQIFRFVSL
ncbi:MAG TPA: hypothetical protein VKU03_00200, partial [Roseiarcus sp.]|nr:hypothetical protein [Roseiarcus sp.]